jgi:DNA topoisomerase VI subunit B
MIKEKKMNKRQRKKRMKKYLPIIADEVNLLSMTDNEENKLLRIMKISKRNLLIKKITEILKKESHCIIFFLFHNA